MENKEAKVSLIEPASWMAMPIGLMWAASFLCTMYGTERPLLSMLSTALSLFSIYILFKQLTNFRRVLPDAGWGMAFRLSLVTCLLAGLLTDAVQYAYFAWFDNGRMLSLIAESMQSEAYVETWKRLMPEQNIAEMQAMVQSMTVRDIMQMLILYNILLSVPIALVAALPVRKPRKTEQ